MSISIHQLLRCDQEVCRVRPDEDLQAKARFTHILPLHPNAFIRLCVSFVKQKNCCVPHLLEEEGKLEIALVELDAHNAMHVPTLESPFF